MSATKNESNKLVSLKDIKGSKTNPFVLELKGRMYLQPKANTIIARGQEIVDTTTGEIIQDDVLIGRRKVVDKSQFAKLYASEIGILFELSRPAVNVFLYLTKIMDYENKAIFDYNKEYKELGYKTNVQPLRGIQELITKGIIYPHIVSGIWWLNPTIVCKGERFAKYTEYITEERHAKDEARKRKIEKEKEYIEQKSIEESITKEKGREIYDSLDEETQNKLQIVGNKYQEEYYRSIRSNTLFSDIEEDNPFEK